MQICTYMLDQYLHFRRRVKFEGEETNKKETVIIITRQKTEMAVALIIRFRAKDYNFATCDISHGPSPKIKSELHFQSCLFYQRKYKLP